MVFLCVDVFTYMEAHMCRTCVCMHVEAEVGIKYHPGTLFILFIEAGSLTELRALGLELV